MFLILSYKVPTSPCCAVKVFSGLHISLGGSQSCPLVLDFTCVAKHVCPLLLTMLPTPRLLLILLLTTRQSQCLLSAYYVPGTKPFTSFIISFIFNKHVSV